MINELDDEKWPECEEFYNLMQQYRYTPIENPIAVKQAYEEVKSWLRQKQAALSTPVWEDGRKAGLHEAAEYADSWNYCILMPDGQTHEELGMKDLADAIRSLTNFPPAQGEAPAQDKIK